MNDTVQTFKNREMARPKDTISLNELLLRNEQTNEAYGLTEKLSELLEDAFITRDKDYKKLQKYMRKTSSILEEELINNRQLVKTVRL